MSLKGLVPSSLFVENGLTYANATIPLENQGLVFVRGVNHDTDQLRSNGSGKSSFADILEHILFESTSRGLNKDEIIRAGSSQGYYAKLCLKTPSGVYYIEQSRNHSKHGTSLKISQKFEHGIEEISAPKNINKTKQQLQNQILKMTRQQFNGYVYLSQEAGSPLVTGTGPEVSKYLSSTFGYDIYDDMRLKVKEIIDQTQASVGKSDSYMETIKDIDTKLSEFKDASYILEMEEAFAEYLEFGQAQLSRLQDDRASLARRMALAERRQKILETLPEGCTVDELKRVLAKRQKLASAISNQLVELSSTRKLIESRKSSVERLENLREQISKLHTQAPHGFDNDGEDYADYRSLSESFRDKLHKVNFIVSQGKSLLAAGVGKPEGWDDPESYKDRETKSLQVIAEFKEKEKELLEISSQYDRLKSALDSTVCPTCGQEVPHEDSKEHLAQELARAVAAKRAYKTLQLSKSSAVAFLEARDEFSKYLQDFAEILDSIKTLTGEDTAGDPEVVFDRFLSNNDPHTIKLCASHANKLHEIQSEISILENSLGSGHPVEDESDVVSTVEDLKAKQTTLNSEIQVIAKNIQLLDELDTLPPDSVDDIRGSELIVMGDIGALLAGLRDAQSIRSKFSNDSAIVRDLQSRKEKSLTYLEQFKDDLKKLDWLKLLYKGLAKLKARKIHAVVESIRDTLPSYVETMFDGEDISFDIDDEDPESVLLWALRPHPEKKNGSRVWIPVKGMSKGERAGLRVSLLWTLKDIMQPEKSVDLLILDEADDGLDEAGLSAFCALLGKIRTQYGTVIVISQRRELTGVRFDQVWTAVKKDGITTLEVE